MHIAVFKILEGVICHVYEIQSFNMKFFCFLVWLSIVTQIWTFPRLVSSSFSPMPKQCIFIRVFCAGDGLFFLTSIDVPSSNKSSLILIWRQDGAWCAAECGQGAAWGCHCKAGIPERASGLASALTSFRLSNYAHRTPFLCELVCCSSAAYEQKPESWLTQALKAEAKPLLGTRIGLTSPRGPFIPFLVREK